MTIVQNIASAINNLIPRAHTSEGLRQLQLMTAALFAIYGTLHLSLYMDGMVNHVYFAIEVGSMFLYLFLPAKYEIRPVHLLKRRFFLLVILAAAWVIQPTLLMLEATGDPTNSISMFETREVLTRHVTKTLNQIQIEAILKEGGKVEDGFQAQTFYATQLAAAMQAEAHLSTIIAVFILMEAGFIWNRASNIDESQEASAAPAAEASETKETKKTK